MDEQTQRRYLEILRQELVPALGCTEPIAIAYAGARARQLLGKIPRSARVLCSGAVIKNAKSVTVPCSGGMVGINAAATLGILGGNADGKLEVLTNVREKDIRQAQQLLQQDFCRFSPVEDADGLYIKVILEDGEDSAEVEIRHSHTNISQMIRNGKIVHQSSADPSAQQDGSFLRLAGILEFADGVPLDSIRPVIEPQIEMNSAIAQEGLQGDYGAAIGKTLLQCYDAGDVRVRAKALAAAGSDARMNGCAMPVVINSGSGNQGIAVSLPVIEYARSLDAPRGKLCRALAVANLVALEQKSHIGTLSAFCGAVSAAAGAGAGIAYLLNASREDTARVVTNSLCTAGGIFCDGAKSSCAAKIAAGVDAALLAVESNLQCGRHFCAGEGLLTDDADETIARIGRVASCGMRRTQDEIISIMVEGQ